jgi:hypothetical protein
MMESNDDTQNEPLEALDFGDANDGAFEAMGSGVNTAVGPDADPLGSTEKALTVIPGTGATTIPSVSQLDFKWLKQGVDQPDSSEVKTSLYTWAHRRAGDAFDTPLIAIGGSWNSQTYAPRANYGGLSAAPLAHIWIHPAQGLIEATSFRTGGAGDFDGIQLRSLSDGFSVEGGTTSRKLVVSGGNINASATGTVTLAWGSNFSVSSAGALALAAGAGGSTAAFPPGNEGQVLMDSPLRSSQAASQFVTGGSGNQIPLVLKGSSHASQPHIVGFARSSDAINAPVSYVDSAGRYVGDGSLITNLDAGNIASGTLTVSRGGTGRSTLSNRSVLVGRGTSAIDQVSGSAVDQLLTWQGASDNPSFKQISDLVATSGPITRVTGTTVTVGFNLAYDFAANPLSGRHIFSYPPTSSTPGSTDYAVRLSSAPVGHARGALLQLGDGGWGTGGTDFNGSSSGTYLGSNSVSSFSGRFVDFQKAGVSVFRVDHSGAVLASGAVTATGFQVGANSVVTSILPSGSSPQYGDLTVQAQASSGLSYSVPSAGTIQINVTSGSLVTTRGAASGTVGQAAYFDGTNAVVGENQLSVSRGGTGKGTWSANSIPYASASNTLGEDNAGLQYTGASNRELLVGANSASARWVVGGGYTANPDMARIVGTLTNAGGTLQALNVGTQFEQSTNAVLRGVVSSVQAGAAVATNSVTGFVAAVGSTAAQTSAVSNVIGFSVIDAVKNGSGAFTVQSGLLVNDLTSGTTNYGVRSLVSSGSNKWNLYIDGTADNALAGRIYIGGTSTPAALAELAAGTSAVAPLKFTAGTNLTTPLAGALEWNGTNLFVTQTSGPTRKTLAYTDASVDSFSDILSAAKGGTGAANASPTNGQILVGNASNGTYSKTSLGTGTYLTSSVGAGTLSVDARVNASASVPTTADTLPAYDVNGFLYVNTIDTSSDAKAVANRAYVDAVATGLDIKESSLVATLPNFGNNGDGITVSGSANGSSGAMVWTWSSNPTGSSITAVVSGGGGVGSITYDGQQLAAVSSVGDALNRILVRGLGGPTGNDLSIYAGIWCLVSVTGTLGSGTATFTRASDANEGSELRRGAYTLVEAGSFASKSFVMSNSSAPGVPTLGTDTLQFTQFGGGAQFSFLHGINSSGQNVAANVLLDNSVGTGASANVGFRLQGGGTSGATGNNSNTSAASSSGNLVTANFLVSDPSLGAATVGITALNNAFEVRGGVSNVRVLTVSSSGTLNLNGSTLQLASSGDVTFGQGGTINLNGSTLQLASSGNVTFSQGGTLALNANTLTVSGGNLTLTPATSGTTYRGVGNATNNQFLLSVAGSGSTYPTVAQGAIPFFGGSTHTAMSIAAAGTSSQVLIGGTAPSFGSVALGTMVSGTLAVANGGTGNAASGANGGILYRSSNTSILTTTAGTSGQLVLSGGAGAPTFSNLATILTAAASGGITATGTTTVALSVNTASTFTPTWGGAHIWTAAGKFSLNYPGTDPFASGNGSSNALRSGGVTIATTLTAQTPLMVRHAAAPSTAIADFQQNGGSSVFSVTNSAPTVGSGFPLQLGGATGTPSLKFPSGAVSSPSSGDLWFDSSQNALNFRHGTTTFNLLNTLSNGNTVSGGAASAVLYLDGSGNLVANDNASFTFDSSRKRLAAGQLPSAGYLGHEALEVHRGAIRVGGGPAHTAVATLSAAIANGSTTSNIALSSTNNFPSGGGTVLINGEAIAFTGLSGNSLTGITRAVYGTTGTAHASASTVDLLTFVSTASTGSNPTGRIGMLASGQLGVGTLSPESAVGVRVDGFDSSAGKAGVKIWNGEQPTSGSPTQPSPYLGFGAGHYDTASSSAKYAKFKLEAFSSGSGLSTLSLKSVEGQSSSQDWSGMTDIARFYASGRMDVLGQGPDSGLWIGTSQLYHDLTLGGLRFTAPVGLSQGAAIGVGVTPDAVSTFKQVRQVSSETSVPSHLVTQEITSTSGVSGSPWGLRSESFSQVQAGTSATIADNTAIGGLATLRTSDRGTVTLQRGVFGQALFNGVQAGGQTLTAGSMRGVHAEIASSVGANASGGVTTADALFANINLASTSGTLSLTNLHGVRLASSVGTSNTVTNLYGVRIETPTISGTATHAYGLHIAELPSGGTTRAAVWITGTSGSNRAGIVFNEAGTNLYRSASNTLRTDGTFVAGTGLTVASLTGFLKASSGVVSAQASIGGSDFAAQSANTVFAGPSSGGSATPTFRSLVVSDVPTSSAFTWTNQHTFQRNNGIAIAVQDAADADSDRVVADLRSGRQALVLGSGSTSTFPSFPLAWTAVSNAVAISQYALVSLSGAANTVSMTAAGASSEAVVGVALTSAAGSATNVPVARWGRATVLAETTSGNGAIAVGDYVVVSSATAGHVRRSTGGTKPSSGFVGRALTALASGQSSSTVQVLLDISQGTTTGNVTGSGTADTLPRWGSASTLLDSHLRQSNSGDQVYLGASGAAVMIGAATHTPGTSAALNFAAATAATGGVLFGTDTNLYRYAASALGTDDKFAAALGLEAAHSGGTPSGTPAFTVSSNGATVIRTNAASQIGLLVRNRDATEDASSQIKIAVSDSAGAPLAWIDASGHIEAQSKNFRIEHPTKPELDLVYSCLEGPEQGVYGRGTVEGVGRVRVNFPEYWHKLVQGGDYTVTLGAKCGCHIYIDSQDEHGFTVRAAGWFGRWKPIKFDFQAIGSRGSIEVEQPRKQI